MFISRRKNRLNVSLIVLGFAGLIIWFGIKDSWAFVLLSVSLFLFLLDVRDWFRQNENSGHDG